MAEIPEGAGLVVVENPGSSDGDEKKFNLIIDGDLYVDLQKVFTGQVSDDTKPKEDGGYVIIGYKVKTSDEDDAFSLAVPDACP